VSRVLLPPQLVDELSAVRSRRASNSSGSFGQGEQPVTDVWREHRRGSLLQRMHLTATLGVAGHIERCEGRIRNPLTATSGRNRDRTPVTHEVAEVLRHLTGGIVNAQVRQLRHGIGRFL